MEDIDAGSNIRDIEAEKRIFGSALEKVKNAAKEAQYVGMTDVPSVAPKRRTIVGASRIISLNHNNNLYEALDFYGPPRRTFRIAQSHPYMKNPRSNDEKYNYTNASSHVDNNGEWKHDLFEGPPGVNPGSQIFIRNLPPSVTSQQLTSLFSSVGKVVFVKVDNGPLPTARVGFLKRNSATEAVQKYHGYRLRNQQIKVSEFQSLEDKKRSSSLQRNSASNSRSKGKNNNKSLLRSDAPQISVFDRMT